MYDTHLTGFSRLRVGLNFLNVFFCPLEKVRHVNFKIIYEWVRNLFRQHTNRYISLNDEVIVTILEHETLETELWKEAKEISFTDTFTNIFL